MSYSQGRTDSFPGLFDLLTEAENLGLVTGLNTNGRTLKDNSFVKELENRKLDHIQITLESDSAEIHDAMVGNKGSWEETVTEFKMQFVPACSS